MKIIFEHKELYLISVIFLYFAITLFPVNIDNTQASNMNSNNLINSSDTVSDESSLLLSITIPVQKGFVNGNLSYFITTDASEQRIVASVANTTNHTINFAPSLSQTPESVRQQGYEFTNGVTGNGAFGYQLPIASATSGQEGYSPLFQINYVKWNNESEARILKSVAEIISAESQGDITITKSNIVINSPSVNNP